MIQIYRNQQIGYGGFVAFGNGTIIPGYAIDKKGSEITSKCYMK